MSGFQQVILLGRLGQDPEVKYTQGGTAVCRFSLATSRMERVRGSDDKEEKTTWHSCKAFGRQAEIIGEHLKKGDPLFLEGRLDNWKTPPASDGAVKYGTDVILEHFEFVGGRGGGESRGDGSGSSHGAQAPRGASRGPTPSRQGASRPAPAPAADLPDFADDDIPF